MQLLIASVDSPVGPIYLAATPDGLCALNFDDRWEIARRELGRRFSTITFVPADDPHGAVTELTRYFEGDLAALERLPVDPGGTEFQQRVWRALQSIPAGSTTSYGTLARDIGRPTGSRAVGAANGSNPVSIVIPCHRVIRGDGQLCGYGGGLERKRWLLEHEARQLRM